MNTEPESILPASRNAYELLSKPTLTLTEDEITAIVADLRTRRERFLQGIADKPVRKAKEEQTPEQRQANVESLISNLDTLF